MSELDDLNAYDKKQSPMDQLNAYDNATVKAPSMAAPPAISNAALELKDTWVKSIKKSIGDYGRGGQKILNSTAEKLVPDNPLLQVHRDYLASEQSKADEAIKPYEEAHPMATSMAPLLPEMLLPGKTAGQAMTSGAIIGGLPYGDNQAVDAVAGALGGVIGKTVGDKAGDLIFKGAKRQPGAKAFIDQGGELSVGAQLGNPYKTLEDLSTSVPGSGHMVTELKNKSLQSYSPYRINRILKDVDAKLPDTRKSNGMFEANEIVSKKYDDAFDFEFDVSQKNIDDIASKYTDSGNLTGEQVTALNKIIDKDFIARIKTGKMSGSELKKMDSALRQEQAKFEATTETAYVKELGVEIEKLRDDLYNEFAGQVPGKLEEIRGIDKAFAKLRTLDKAAGSVGAHGGYFTPRQDIAAQKSFLKERGMAERIDPDLIQAETDADFLSTNVGNSFTTDRANVADAVGAVGGAAMGYNSLDSLIPLIGGAGLLGAGASKPAQKAISTALFDRPQNAAWKELEKYIAPLIRQGLLVSGANEAPGVKDSMIR